MSEAAISAAFFDPEGGTYGSLRAGVGVIFRGDRPEITDRSPELVPDGDGWRVALDDAELSFESLSEEMRLGGGRARVCRVRGRVSDRALDCLGTIVETGSPPAWSELDATRWISAIFDADHAVLAFARRPRGARGHGEEELTGWVLDGGELRGVEDARVSTVYDGDGRQRSARLELWLPAEDFPRRGAGEARAGVSLALEGLNVHAAVFGWRMDGRDGIGAYELTVRDPGDAAA